MNIELLTKAKERVPSIPVLINMVSKRVRQLNGGFRPYVKPESPDEEKVDIALREIAEQSSRKWISPAWRESSSCVAG